MGKQIFDRTKKILCIFMGIFFVISMTAVLIGAAAPPNENIIPTDQKITPPPSDHPQEITPPPSDHPQEITPPPSKKHPPRCIHWRSEKKCDRWDPHYRSKCIHWHWEKRCDRWGPY